MTDANKKIYDKNGKELNIGRNNLMGVSFYEHCDFKDAPCNYMGWGWYDRCVFCKDNNGFRRKKDQESAL